MVKTTKKTKPASRAAKKTTVKKVVAQKPTVTPKSPVENLLSKPEALKSLSKTNLLPLAVFLVSAFVLISLFLFLRKNLIVATINGQPITRFEVIKLLETQSGKQTVDGLVSKALLQQEGKRAKITIPASQLEEEIKKIEQQLKAQGNSLESALAMQGMTKKDLEEQIELRLILEKLMAGKTKVSEKEVQAYIETNRANYPETIGEEELTKTVRDQLENQKLSTEAQKLLEDLKNKAKINYYINY